MKNVLLFFCVGLFCQVTFAQDSTPQESVWTFSVIEHALTDLNASKEVQQKYGDSLLYGANVAVQDYYLEVVFDTKDSIVLISEPWSIADRSYKKAKLRTQNKVRRFLESIEVQNEKLPQTTFFQHFNFAFSVSINDQKQISAKYKMTVINNEIVILDREIELVEQGTA